MRQKGHGAPLRWSWRSSSWPLRLRWIQIHQSALSKPSVFLCGCCKGVLLNDQAEIYDAKDQQQGCHLFSQMTSHALSSRIHPPGTLPIMAWKWRKMKSQNDRLKRDYLWCSIPCGGHFLALFILFTWKMGVLFSQTEKKKSSNRYNQDGTLSHGAGQWLR